MINSPTSAAILHFAEVADATAMYPYAAIILLPINSSLNPILYSDMLDVIDSTLKKWFNKQPNLKAAFDSLGPVIKLGVNNFNLS